MTKEELHIYELSRWVVVGRQLSHMMRDLLYDSNDVWEKYYDIVDTINEDMSNNRLIASNKINNLLDILYDAILLEKVAR